MLLDKTSELLPDLDLEVVNSNRNGGLIYFITLSSTLLVFKNKNLGLLSEPGRNDRNIMLGSHHTKVYSYSFCFCIEIQQLICEVLGSLGHILKTRD